MSSHQPFLLGLNDVAESVWKSTPELYNLVGQNTGNMAFHEGVRRIVRQKLATISWFSSPDQIDLMGDIGIIPAANQIGAHADFANLAQRFGELKTRLVTIGLGAQSSIDEKIPEVPEGTLRWVKEIVTRSPSAAPNILVRGQFTKTVLDHYGFSDRVVVGGCPSLFINPRPDLGRQIEKKLSNIRSIAVAAGHHRWSHLSKIEAKLVDIAKRTNGTYVGSSPLEMIHLTRGEGRLLSSEAIEACRDYACPNMTIDEFIVWTNLHGRAFFDVWSWMEHYRRYDLVVGARIHGIVLALQAGVPGLCVAHDSRTLELCRTMMIPHITPRMLGPNFDLDKLVEAAALNGAAFDINRKKLSEIFIEFLSTNNIGPSEQMFHIQKMA